jgi:hypothetical protein
VQTGRRVAVIDWSGDWPGLDVAELLSAAGKEVTLVSSTLYPGEALHQYVRNVYLETMYRQGVTMMPHYELVEVQNDAVVLRNLFSNELKALEQIDTVVLALGRRRLPGRAHDGRSNLRGHERGPGAVAPLLCRPRQAGSAARRCNPNSSGRTCTATRCDTRASGWSAIEQTWLVGDSPPVLQSQQPVELWADWGL